MPFLVAPNEVTRVALSTPEITGAAPRSAAPLRTTVVQALSKLSTLDNCLANIQVWFSDLTVTAGFDPGQAWYEAYYDWRATFPNWIQGPGLVIFSGVSSTQATISAGADFFGYFPLGFIQFWHGSANHRIVMRQPDHDTWLHGWIDAVQLFPPAVYSPWKERQFFNGETFANDGSRQDRSWCIVGD